MKALRRKPPLVHCNAFLFLPFSKALIPNLFPLSSFLFSRSFLFPLSSFLFPLSSFALSFLFHNSFLFVATNCHRWDCDSVRVPRSSCLWLVRRFSFSLSFSLSLSWAKLLLWAFISFCIPSIIITFTSSAHRLLLYPFSLNIRRGVTALYTNSPYIRLSKPTLPSVHPHSDLPDLMHDWVLTARSSRLLWILGISFYIGSLWFFSHYRQPAPLDAPQPTLAKLPKLPHILSPSNSRGSQRTNDVRNRTLGVCISPPESDVGSGS